MRSSVVFLGAILARCGQAEMTYPGGCELGARPIDLHLAALRSMGAAIQETGGRLACRRERLTGTEIVLSLPSVGATENAMLAACGAEGTTVIANAAREPEIVDLQTFLQKMGAHVQGAGSSTVVVEGGAPLHGCVHTVVADRIVAATYLAAAAGTGGDIRLEGVDYRHLSAVATMLRQAGCRLTCGETSIRLQAPRRLQSAGPIRTAPYPGFPTDAQAVLMASLLRSEGATVFVEPQAVVEANARILQYRAQEAQEIERILVAFTAQVAAIEPQFQYSYKAMLEIDVLLAKARLALDLKAFKPAVRTDDSFSLIRARHPLIDPKKCVPVDIALGRDYDSLIITGPNTGGKTVTLKTAGLLCAMAQCGFLIPADERSEICVFDEFLVDIGDEQSIEQSLSTFSGHMKKITGILELAMPHTLVLLDELGAGTDPAEGAALAVAIIEELRRRGVLLMATTHYAELKVFALETKGVVNASCEFDLETLRPTYKLSVGVPGKSNAFLISEKLGIPERVIEAAQQHLSAEDKRLDAVLGQLDDLKLQLKESQNEVEELKNEASHQLEAAQKKRDELIRQGENELEAARAKARALAQQVESQAYALTDELRQLQKDERMSTQQKAQRAREIAKKESEKLFIGSEAVHNPVKEFVPLKEVKVGQEVCIAELNQLATVLALPDKNGDVLVRAGIIKTKVPLNGLKQPEKLVKEKKPQTKAQQRYSRLTGDANRPNGRVERVQRSAKMECNLLGLTVDEALPEVDSFIDRAILNGQTVVYLIHGNGTGALRTAIHKHLRGNRMVKSFRLGRYGEGESGVTVVELK